MFKFFEFKDGKFTTFPQLTQTNIKNSILASVIILIVVSLSMWLKIDQKDIWKFYNIVIQQFGLQKQVPKIEVEKQIEAKIELEVDSALRRYEKSERPTPPRMTNKGILKEIESPKYSDTQRVIVKDAIYYECPGGVMGIRAVWIPKDPQCIDNPPDSN